MSEKISEAVKDKMDPVPQIDIYSVPPIESFGEQKVVFAPKNEAFASGKVAFASSDESLDLKQVVSLVIEKLENGGVGKVTIANIAKMYEMAITQAMFSRKDIMKWIGYSSKEGARKLLNVMKEYSLVEQVTGHGKGKYRLRTDMMENKDRIKTSSNTLPGIRRPV